MNNCSKCGAATELKSGISKKTGKNWSANVCKECGNFDFINQQKTLDTTPKDTQFANTATLNRILVLLEQIEKNTRKDEKVDL